METEEAITKIKKLVKEKDGGISFVEIEMEFGNDAKGEYGYNLDGKNIVLWDSLSKELLEAIKFCTTKDIIEMKPCMPVIYSIDGKVLDLPLAKRIPKNGYKKTRWLPVVFNKGKNFDI